MAIENKPFVAQRLEEEKKPDEDVFVNMRFNKEWQDRLKVIKKVLEQPKDSTAVKQCILIAQNVLQDQKTADLLAIVFKNKRNNARLGIVEFEID